MLEDVFDFFFRHPLLCNCLKIMVGGCVVAGVLGFGAAGFAHAFFGCKLFWEAFKVVVHTTMIVAIIKCLWLCVCELFFR